MTVIPVRSDTIREPERLRVPLPDVSGWQLAVVLLVLVVATVALRLFRLDESFDLFLDEITYLRLGQGLLISQFPPVLYGEPFFLHPPLFFYIESAFLWLFGVGEGVFGAVNDLRVLNVALSGMTAAAICMIGKRTAGIWTGVVAALVFAVDPFSIKINSRILLETAAVLLIALGYLVLATSITRVGEVTIRASIMAGALFGLAILTKEVSAAVTIGPLLIMGLFGFAITRRQAFTIAGAAILTYVPYPLLAALSGQWSVFLDDKQGGILRFMGSIQTTGFNRQGSVPFQSRVFELVESLGTTYVLLAVGFGATIGLLWKGTRTQRIVAVWAAGSYAFAGYSIVAGALEEQLFYFVIVPAILVTTTFVARIVHARSALWRQALLHRRVTGWTHLSVHRVRLRRAARSLHTTRVGIAASAFVLILASLTIWLNIHTEPDDAYSQLLGFMTENVPPGASIAVGATSDTAEYVLGGSYVAVKATGINELRRAGVQYVILGTKSIEDGTVFSGIADDDAFVEAHEQLTLLIDWLETNGKVVFSARGRSTGTLVLYDVRASLG